MIVSFHGQDGLFDSHTESVRPEIVVSWLVCRDGHASVPVLEGQVVQWSEFVVEGGHV